MLPYSLKPCWYPACKYNSEARVQTILNTALLREQLTCETAHVFLSYEHAWLFENMRGEKWEAQCLAKYLPPNVQGWSLLQFP